MPIPWEAYDRDPLGFAEQYEALSFLEVHGNLRPWLPAPPARVLDVGAGSGRDAAWLAGQGLRVLAVEPSAAMLAQAQARHADCPIQWLADALPGLPAVGAQTFALILLSGVWMHVPPEDREPAYARLAGLLAPGGHLAMSLRLGPAPEGRVFHPIPAGHLEGLAAQHGLTLALREETPDVLGRGEVQWLTWVWTR